MGLTDLDGNRKKLPTKSFPGAVKCTRENLSAKDCVFTSGKLSMKLALLMAYATHTIVPNAMISFVFIIP